MVAISLIFPQTAFDWEVYKEKITTSEDTVCTPPFPSSDLPTLFDPKILADIHGCKVVVPISLKALDWGIYKEKVTTSEDMVCTVRPCCVPCAL